MQCAPCATDDPQSEGIQSSTWLTELSQEQREELGRNVDSLAYLSDLQKRGLIANVENRLGVVAGAREITLYLFLEVGFFHPLSFLLLTTL